MIFTPWTIRAIRAWILVAALVAVPSAARGAEPDDSDSLTQLSIEDLMNLEVSLVSRKPERRADAPAAVYVITRADIERSPALTVPELLRNVPGLNVARIDASKWSITIRGFSGQLARKLQVLVDGRSIFTPVFSGVTWEDHFMPLDLIERIEVIRGPGGATWGANAVNGIINIITRSAADSQGGALVLGAGTELESMGTLTYGGKLSTGSLYRAYLHAIGVRESDGILAQEKDDDWRGAVGGLRWDGDLGDDHVMLAFDAMSNRLHDAYEGPFALRPAQQYRANTTRNQSFTTVGRWTRALSETSELSVQTSFHHYESDSIILAEWRNTFTADMQHRFEAGLRHEIVWGLGASYYNDRMGPGEFFAITPDRRRYRLASGFFQDQMRWFDDRLSLTAGLRAEYSDQGGANWQPSLRLAWTTRDRNTTWWAAVSRAVNTPSRSELGSRLDIAAIPGFAAAYSGNPDFEPEALIATEFGVRSRLRENLVVDLALFYNDYDHSRSLSVTRPRLDFSGPAPVFVIPLSPGNEAGAIARGVEITFDWEPLPRWRTRLGWSWLEVQVRRHRRGLDPITPLVADDTPAHQLFWQHHFTLPHEVNLDFDFRYTGPLEGLDVEDYTTLDVRLGWSPREDLLLEIVGQNLLDSSHQEYETSILSTVVSRAERGVYGSVTWKF